MTSIDPAAEVTTEQIADLTAWCRRLSETGPRNPAELTAYHHAKAALLARLTGPPHPDPPTTKDTR
jgi:hypothetical protein